MVRVILLRVEDKVHKELQKAKAEVCLAFGEKTCSWERFFLASSRYVIKQLKDGSCSLKE